MSEYMKILKMIENGEISPDEGARLLQEVGAGTPSPKEPMDTLGILSKIDQGEISAEEGIHLLENSQTDAEEDAETDSPEEEFTHNHTKITDEEVAKWQQWWTIPLYVGLGIVVLSVLWLNSAYQNSGYGFWFFCSWLPLTLGVLLMALSWRSKSGPWIHVRVRGPKENVAISIPAPIGLTSWALRNFGHFIPQLEKTSVDEILIALESTSKNNAPLSIVVDEGDNGEHVEVFIG